VEGRFGVMTAIMILIAAATAVAGVVIGLRVVMRQLGARAMEVTAFPAPSAGRQFDRQNPATEERYMRRFQPPHDQALAHLIWEAGGEKRSLDASVLNLSNDGARIKTRVPLAPETSVVIQMPGSKLAGTARVRYCEAQAFAYCVGLQFHGQLFKTP